MDDYIDMYEDEKDKVIDVTRLQNLLKDKKEEIDTIEIYYNPHKLKLKYDLDSKLVLKDMFGNNI